MEMVLSTQRIVDRYMARFAGQEIIHKEEIDQLHKDLLTYVSNIKKKTITHNNINTYLESLVEFRAKYNNLGLAIDNVVESVFKKINSEETTRDSINNLRTLQRIYNSRSLIDDFAQKIMEFPPLNRYSAPTEQQMIERLLAKGYPLDQVENYVATNGVPSQESLDKMAMDEWLAGVGKKWAGAIERLSRKVKEFLNNLVAFLDYLGEPLIAPKNTDEITQLEGLSVIMTDFGDDPEMVQHLDSFKQALKIFKTNAKKRYPLLLKVIRPIRAYWGTNIPSHLGNGVGGFYQISDAKISLTPLGLQKNPREIAHILAHEMGHHIWKMVLKKDQQKFWSEAIFEDHKEKLSVAKLLDIMQSKRIIHLQSDKWKEIDTILYIQLQTLIFSMPNPPLSMGDLEKMLEKGQTYLRVPKNPITGYAGMDAEEAFCEALGMFVAYGTTVLMPLVMKWLGTILNINKMASEDNMKPSSTRVAYAYLEKQAQLEREAGLKDIWQDWIQTPFESILRNAPKFKKEAVDEVFDDIVRDVAPLVSIEIQKQIVEKLFLEFEKGMFAGAIDGTKGSIPKVKNHKLIFPKYRKGMKDIDWYNEGYTLAYSTPSFFKGSGKIDRKVRNTVMHGILMQEEDDIAENVIGDKMTEFWNNINPIEVAKTIWKMVKEHGWKVGAALALVQIIETAVIPAVVVSVGFPELAVISSQLPITEIAIPIMAKMMNIQVGEPDIPTVNLDSYIEDQGSIRFAAVSFNTFERTIDVLSKKMKTRAKTYEQDMNRATAGNEFYAELGRNKISYDPVVRVLTINDKSFSDIDTKELLPTLVKNIKK